MFDLIYILFPKMKMETTIIPNHTMKSVFSPGGGVNLRGFPHAVQQQQQQQPAEPAAAAGRDRRSDFATEINCKIERNPQQTAYICSI